MSDIGKRAKSPEKGKIAAMSDKNMVLHAAGAGGRNLTFGMLDAIGREIVIGHYDNRPFPIEADIAVRFGVSRSVVREAIKMLSAKGLLTARPRKGTSVQPSEYWNLFDPDVLSWILERKFSLELLRQFSELRLAIEPMAATIAARAHNADSLSAIQAGFERMSAADAGADNPLEADIAFHVAILLASGNPFYMQFRDVVSTALRTSIRFTNRLKGHTASLQQHHDVLSAIKRHDGEGAAKAMRILIDDVMELIAVAEAER